MDNYEKIYRAKMLRYKKSMLDELNFDYIQNKFYEIKEECDEIRYYIECGDDTLLNALDGDDEQEFEIRMMFADLSGECEILSELINDDYTYFAEEGYSGLFDNFFVGIMCGNRNPFEVLGFDGYQEDYYKLLGYDVDFAENEAFKRLMRLKKEDIIRTAGRCFSLAVSFFNVMQKYDYLKASFDILKNDNTKYLQLIKEIDKAYEEAEEVNFYGDAGQKFDKFIKAVPDKVWLE